MVKVKNMNGTSSNYPKPTCKCKNWLEHWEYNRWGTKKNMRLAKWCRGCRKTFNHAELNGAHVIKESSTDCSRYIIPLCDSCHGKTDDCYIVDEEDLVSANCEKCINI